MLLTHLSNIRGDLLVSCVVFSFYSLTAMAVYSQFSHPAASLIPPSSPAAMRFPTLLSFSPPPPTTTIELKL